VAQPGLFARCTRILAGAFIAATLGAAAPAGSEDEAAAGLPAELLGWWIDFVSPELVITSEPQIYLFCPGGDWFSYGSKGTRPGRYSYRDGELCQQMGGWRGCKRLEKTVEGYVLRGATPRESARIKVLDQSVGPASPCAQTLDTVEPMKPWSLPAGARRP
jgi:hypothetical protein